MLSKKLRILVFFVEARTYILDLIHEVYEKTPWEYSYVFCSSVIEEQCKDEMPSKYEIANHNVSKKVKSLFDRIVPDFVIVNGYVGKVQLCAINQCKKRGVPYAIESDTPLNIPNLFIKAKLKEVLLNHIFKSDLCYGFPGGTLQQENFIHYGLDKDKNYIMPMSTSLRRTDKILQRLPKKGMLKSAHKLSENRVILYVGRLVEEKNIALLIDAYAELKKEFQDLVLLIVGSGSLYEKLTQYVEEIGAQDIRFEGFRSGDELVEYYRMADVFVLPSSYEPWGLVVNEAMASGVPVVVSSVVGCRVDLVKEGYNGSVFENGNGLQLINSIKIILNSSMDIYGDNARKTVEGWNFDKYLERFIPAVEEICVK